VCIGGVVGIDGNSKYSNNEVYDTNNNNDTNTTNTNSNNHNNNYVSKDGTAYQV